VVTVVATIDQIEQERGRSQEQRGAGADTADRELAARLSAGDPDALAEAYRRYAGLVFGISQRVLNDRTMAEDVTQEVFVFLWQSPARFDPARGTMRAWLGMLAHRRAIDRVRAESRRTKGETRCDPTTTIMVSEVDAYLTTAWLSSRVRDALGRLPAEQRDVVVLAYYGNRTYRQVADDLGLPEGTVKSRVRLALKKLDTILRSEFTDEDEPAWT
jgi:RNA polymerase sigma-70 factor (ECF subfamily)